MRLRVPLRLLNCSSLINLVSLKHLAKMTVKTATIIAGSSKVTVGKIAVSHLHSYL